MALRGVIFDLGGTLLHYKPPGGDWEDMEKLGAQAVYRLLSEAGHALPPEAHALDIAWEHALALWGALDSSPVSELKLARQTEIVLSKWGITGLPSQQVEALGEAYVTAIQAIVRPLDGAQATLSALREQGLRIGLVSNTHWPGTFHEADLDRYDLTCYLDHRVFSADVDAWKPHAPVFHMALDTLELRPSEAIFVGDSLYFDVWGAQQAGMRGVWIEQNPAWKPPHLSVTPDATITSLPQLLDLVTTWR